jgi:hypothetical protein
MTSVLRRPDQIPPRTRYLLCIGEPRFDVSENFSSGGVTAFTVPQGTFGPIDQIADGPILSVSGLTLYPLYTGDLFRDLGRSLYVYEPSPPGSSQVGAGSLQVAIFRQVMKIEESGYNNEGVSASMNMITGPSLYVKVWTSLGNGVVVTRTG